MAVFVTDTSIWSMDDEFGMLVARDASRCVNGLLLRVVHRGRPLIAGSLNSPTILMRDNMLILAYHDDSPKLELLKAQPLDWVANGRPL